MGRLEKINEQLKREIGLIIHRELGDPRLEFVSITYVQVSRDLRHAKVHFSVLGNEKKSEEAQQGLEAAKGLIRKKVGQQMSMRFTPELLFAFDHSLEYSAKIDKTLQDIYEKDNPLPENYSDDQKA